MNSSERCDYHHLMKLRRMNHLEFARGFPDIEIGKIGEKVGEGKAHVVYAYGADQVIKFPTIRALNPVLLPTPTADVKHWELETIKSNFPTASLETEVLSASTHPFYCMVQRRLHGFDNLSPTNIHLVNDQLNELLESNRKLVDSEQASLDFLGEEGLKKSVAFLIRRLLRFKMTGDPEISNVVIENSSAQCRLVITDVSLLRFGAQYWNNSFNQQRARRVSLETHRINQHFMKRCFGLDI